MYLTSLSSLGLAVVLENPTYFFVLSHTYLLSPSQQLLTSEKVVKKDVMVLAY